jgi:anti-sigma B factor antagonist
MPSEVTNNGTAPPKPPVPPMPSEVTTARRQRPAAGVVRTAISPLRKLMRRAPRHA